MKNILIESRYGDPEELTNALSAEDFFPYKLEAEKISKRNFSDKVHLRGIIEFSNLCEKDCYYCGIRNSNKQKRYCMPSEEIVKTAIDAYKQGFGSVVLQSGENRNKPFLDFVIKTISKIKKETKELDKKNKGVGITLSIGELNKKDYEELFQTGAHRYLMRIETSNKKLYGKLHPNDGNHSFENRLKCLKTLKEIGYQVGTGIMIGLPGQTTEDLANDLLFFKEIDVDMVGMGPYIIHSSTPLAKKYSQWWDKNKKIIFDKSLRMISLLRILMPDINIASTTALQAMNPFGRELGLTYGANIVMPNITPKKYRPLYKLYENKLCIDEDSDKCFNCMNTRIKSVGKKPALYEWGDSKHFFGRKGATG